MKEFENRGPLNVVYTAKLALTLLLITGVVAVMLGGVNYLTADRIADIAAEKRAQANVITRREEVASTRSLLNTAKLMDENATLRRLKELEYLEKISANVGSISVNLGEEQLKALAGKE